MITLFKNPEHWRQRAEEARILAQLLADQDAKHIMLNIASGYDTLAKRAADGALRWRATGT